MNDIIIKVGKNDLNKSQYSSIILSAFHFWEEYNNQPFSTPPSPPGWYSNTVSSRVPTRQPDVSHHLPAWRHLEQGSLQVQR